MTGGVPQRMANMALVCACIVALSHVGYDTDVGSAGWWFVRMTRCGICCLAVPFFFVVFVLDGFRAPRANKSIGFMLAEFAAAVAVPSVMALLLRRIFPRVAAFAFGGR